MRRVVQVVEGSLPKRKSGHRRSLLTAAVATVLLGGTTSRADDLFFEAESFDGSLSSGFDTFTHTAALPGGTGSYIAVNSNATSTPPANTAVYNLNFGTTGNYHLYARLWAEGDSDANDSLFLPNVVGTPTAWTTINNLRNSTPGGPVVHDVAGDFHWVNLITGAGYNYGGVNDKKNTPYAVTAGANTFTVGGREDGLRIDAFVMSTNADLSLRQLNTLSGVTNPTLTVANMTTAPSAGTMRIREVRSATAINSQDEAHAALAAGDVNDPTTVVEYEAPVLNIHGTGTTGRFGSNAQFRVVQDGLEPNPNPPAEPSHVALQAQGTVRITAAGTYTFGVNSDDGFTLLFPGQDFTPRGMQPDDIETDGGGLVAYSNGTAFAYRGSRGVTDSLAQIDFAAPGDYPFVLTYHQGAGGSGLEFFAAQGAHTGFNNSFNLVGAAAIPDVQVDRKGPAVVGNAADSPVAQGTGGWNLTRLRDDTTPDNLDSMQEAVDAFHTLDPSNTMFTVTNETATVVYHKDPSSFSNHSPGTGYNDSGATARLVFPADASGDTNDLVMKATAQITVDEAGKYTFVLRSDDHSQFRIIGTDGDWESNGGSISLDLIEPTGEAARTDGFRLTGSNNNAFAAVLLDPGTYDVEYIFFENTGGAHAGLWVAQGDHTAFDERFQLLGENIDGTGTLPGRPAGLELVGTPVPEPTGLALLGLPAMLALRRRRRHHR